MEYPCSRPLSPPAPCWSPSQDNADLSDLLENDLDETFLFRHRAHMALNKDNKVKNMNKQMDRILQQEENDDEEDFSAPPSSMSPTPASTSRGDIFSNAPTASPTFTGRGIVDLPSSSPTASPTSIDGDGGISRDASAAWRQTGAGLVGAVGAAAAVAVAVAVATAGLTMTGVVF